MKFYGSIEAIDQEAVQNKKIEVNRYNHDKINKEVGDIVDALLMTVDCEILKKELCEKDVSNDIAGYIKGTLHKKDDIELISNVAKTCNISIQNLISSHPYTTNQNIEIPNIEKMLKILWTASKKDKLKEIVHGSDDGFVLFHKMIAYITKEEVFKTLKKDT